MSVATRFLFFSALLAFFSACQPGGDDSTDGVEAISETEPSPSAALYTTYETFDEIAPLFNKQTDTTYVINFWATWCKPCVEELPYFQKLHETYQDEKVKVILVSLDFPNQIESKFIPFLEKNQLGPEIALLLDDDVNSWGNEVDPSWGGAIPITLVYKGDDRSFHGTQYASYDELKQMVDQVL